MPDLTSKLSLLPLLKFGHLGMQEQIVWDAGGFSMWLLLFSSCVFLQRQFHNCCVSLVDAGMWNISQFTLKMVVMVP